MSKKTESEISADQIRELLHYDPEAGVFIWKISRGRVKSGSPAGSMHSHGYMQIRISSKNYYSHRLAWLYMTGNWPEGDIDHINGCKVDNRFDNLRSVSCQENNRNYPMYRTNTSGFVGVSFNKISQKWLVQISDNGNRISIGFFDSKKDAVIARKSAELRYGYHENHGRISNDR